MQLFSTKRSYTDAKFSFFCAYRPFVGEFFSGDREVFFRGDGYVLVGLIDGMGHGAKASEVALKYKEYIEQNHHMDVEFILSHLHENMRGTLGAAVAIAKVFNDGLYHFVGVGNISCEIHSYMTRQQLISKDGAIAQYMNNLNVVKNYLDYDEALVMYSDGIQKSVFKNNFRVPLVGSESLAVNVIDKFGKDSDDVSFLYLNRELDIDDTL